MSKRMTTTELVVALRERAMGLEFSQRWLLLEAARQLESKEDLERMLFCAEAFEKAKKRIIVIGGRSGKTQAMLEEMLKRFIGEADCVNVTQALKYLEYYSFADTKQVYTNGTVLVPLFRVQQALLDKAYNGLQEG